MNTSISIERRTRNVTPSPAYRALMASILRPWSARRSGSCPFAIFRLWEWSVAAMKVRPSDRAASAISSSGNDPSLSVL
jgi:hypothetical protein